MNLKPNIQIAREASGLNTVIYKIPQIEMLVYTGKPLLLIHWKWLAFSFSHRLLIRSTAASVLGVIIVQGYREDEVIDLL